MVNNQKLLKRQKSKRSAVSRMIQSKSDISEVEPEPEVEMDSEYRRGHSTSGVSASLLHYVLQWRQQHHHQSLCTYVIIGCMIGVGCRGLATPH
jgi:hypothetical protein